jgi:hypothetical protein
LIEYLPRSKQGCIIFTTRDRKTAVKLAQQNVIEVLEMDEHMAMQLLQKYLINQDLVNNEQDTKALLAQLTYLPLAIVQAAAYINETGIALADYLSLLADQEEEVIELLSEDFENDGRYRSIKNSGVKKSVAATRLISFEQIRHRDPFSSRLSVVHGMHRSKGHSAASSPGGAVAEEGDRCDRDTLTPAHSILGMFGKDDRHRITDLVTCPLLGGVFRFDILVTRHPYSSLWTGSLTHRRWIWKGMVWWRGYVTPLVEPLARRISS